MPENAGQKLPETVQPMGCTVESMPFLSVGSDGPYLFIHVLLLLGPTLGWPRPKREVETLINEKLYTGHFTSRLKKCCKDCLF